MRYEKERIKRMKRMKPERPVDRDLSPVSEQEVLKIIHETDKINEVVPTMEDAEFLAELYKIVDVLGEECILPTSKAVEVMHLRAKREGYPFKYTRAALVNRNQNGSLYALSRDELLKLKIGVPKKQLMFPLRDVLKVSLGRWPAGHRRKHKALRFSKPGRPSKEMQEKMERVREEFRKDQLAHVLASSF
jgi:hypothetical protein